MSRVLHQANSESREVRLTIDDLIRSELEGKVAALTRYDEILWRIRTGYVAITYGALVLLVGKESQALQKLLGPAGVLSSLVPLACALSVAILLIDLSFLFGKLRVVHARNQLSDIALRRTASKSLSLTDTTALEGLLHMAGEGLSLPPVRLLAAGTWPLIAIYASMPGMLLYLAR